MEQLMQRHRHFEGVRDFNAHGILAGNRREDIDPLGAGGAGDVRFQLGDPRHPQARGGVNFVARDRRATGDVSRRHLDAEGLQGLDDGALGVEEFFAVCFGCICVFIDVQQIKSRKLVILKTRH